MTTTLERPKTLPEAKAILAKLAPGEPPPKTLARARDRIEELTGKRQNPITPAPVTSPMPAANLFSKASEIALKYGSSSARRVDPQDLTAAELEAQIEAEKDPEKRMELFHELQAREAGKPTRSVRERAARMTITELEQAITNERDPEVRGALFKQLLAREGKK